MTCNSCAAHVEKALRSVSGVVEATVPGWESGIATIIMEDSVDPAELEAAVAKAGYRASVKMPALEKAASRPRAHRSDGSFDLLVIGGGSAGFAAAIRGAELGYQVALVNDGLIGGTCVNIGCVPSKALIRAAEAWYKAGHHPFDGVHTRAEWLDWAAVRAHKDALVSILRREKYVDVLQAYPQIDFIAGRARFQADGSVLVGEQTLRAAKYVITTGARPRILPIPGVEEVQPLTSTSLMELDALPKSLVILGGRAVALELGQTMARFGVQVTILQRSALILPEHEPEISQALTEVLQDEGLGVVTGVQVKHLALEDGQRAVYASVNGRPQIFRAEQILLALGRQPNTDDLELNAVSVQTTTSGNIVVDDHMRTTCADIYAAGDCTTLPRFVYVAAAGGSLAAENALLGENRRLDLSAMPAVVFTDPQVATVGLTEAQARQRKINVKTSLLPLTAVPRALAARDTRGLIKLIANTENDHLLGVHILAAEAGEVVQTAALAVKFGLRVQDLCETLFPYLTQVEGLKLAALAFEKDVAKLSCCAG
jgi:mercuric reductase